MSAMIGVTSGMIAAWLPMAATVTMAGATAVAGVPLLMRTHRQGRRILVNWADRCGFRLVRSRCRILRRGPFLAKSSARQVVFRVMVEAPDGLQRQGYVRIGHRWIGTQIRQVSVKWDDVPGMVHEKV